MYMCVYTTPKDETWAFLCCSSGRSDFPTSDKTKVVIIWRGSNFWTVLNTFVRLGINKNGPTIEETSNCQMCEKKRSGKKQILDWIFRLFSGISFVGGNLLACVLTNAGWLLGSANLDLNGLR